MSNRQTCNVFRCDKCKKDFIESIGDARYVPMTVGNRCFDLCGSCSAKVIAGLEQSAEWSISFGEQEFSHRFVWCKYCNRTHNVLISETPCGDNPNNWIDQ